MEKYRTARQATDDNKIRRMRFACWITKATETHSEYVTTSRRNGSVARLITDTTLFLQYLYVVFL